MSEARSARERALRLYDATAARTSAGVLAAYSTSFGLGTRLLGRRAQQDIRAVYALVRLADEVVDTYRGQDAGAELDELEEQTARALRTGYSTNLVVHAFARTARRTGITAAETGPFFASMRTDLTVRAHDRASYDAYVYGSAEVVGLMCVRAFLNEDRRPDEPVRHPDDLQVAGARALGAAFQKINFLRDLGADTEELGRTYFPGTTPGRLDHAQLRAILAEITADVAVARSAVPRLPRRARYAVGATLGLYQRLLDEIATRPPESLLVGRVRLPTPVKLLVVGESVLAEARAGRAVDA
ncbi:phytoene/squalene synthase family protein [Cellulomonas fengjieae]|uniref:Squalene/phytoene synthase family protein n=1 Tax=Cellulomonas fengjieae TaxID=2819978 RepID=A0ABS3SC45_9CELL|nr:squalene/phytoene synthase family protein [Cellulomonas fengjieae]MBO3083313.1 squalene/phytoene synthase family protein [Cellulomonas fengjieae]MBO3101939.1 squalene/phytoene synthase family protein [Cellulomonas fengjieae]QVI65338.1 squalene/phytoene synthase family protein [Cellulomonas fengjieae]